MVSAASPGLVCCAEDGPVALPTVCGAAADAGRGLDAAPGAARSAPLARFAWADEPFFFFSIGTIRGSLRRTCAARSSTTMYAPITAAVLTTSAPIVTAVITMVDRFDIKLRNPYRPQPAMKNAQPAISVPLGSRLRVWTGEPASGVARSQ